MRKLAIVVAAILCAATEAPADPKQPDHQAHRAAHQRGEAHQTVSAHRHRDERHAAPARHRGKEHHFVSTRRHREAQHAAPSHTREAHRVETKHRDHQPQRGPLHARTRGWDRSTGNSTSLAGFPAPLVQKVDELKAACGAKVISSYRPGSVMCDRGRCIASNHALKKAADVTGKPSCLYAHLKHWEGGYSTDYAAVQHVHISYNRHSTEWGTRFTHHMGRAIGRAVKEPTPTAGQPMFWGAAATQAEAAR